MRIEPTTIGLEPILVKMRHFRWSTVGQGGGGHFYTLTTAYGRNHWFRPSVSHSGQIWTQLLNGNLAYCPLECRIPKTFSFIAFFINQKAFFISMRYFRLCFWTCHNFIFSYSLNLQYQIMVIVKLPCRLLFRVSPVTTVRIYSTGSSFGWTSVFRVLRITRPFDSFYTCVLFKSLKIFYGWLKIRL